jgi:hypothetical protein
MNYLLAQALHLLQDLLCVESYVFMSPFYYSDYQSTLFCVGTLMKFVSHNDVCVCLSIVLYLLILTYIYMILSKFLFTFQTSCLMNP